MFACDKHDSTFTCEFCHELHLTILCSVEAYLSQHCRSHYEQRVGNGCFINGEALNKSG